MKIFYKTFFYFLNKYKAKLAPKNIGRKTYIDKTVNVIGWRNVQVGYNTIISEGTWLNVNDRDHNKLSIQIGNNCYIGKRNFFLSGNKIVISDFFMSGINCSFLGSNHEITNPLIPYVLAKSTNNNTIKIGVNCWLASNVTLLGDITIGHGCVIGANSLVLTDIPPFSMAVGSPAKIIKRFCFEQQAWIKEIEQAVISYENEQDYLSELRKYDKLNMPYYASGKNYGDLF